MKARTARGGCGTRQPRPMLRQSGSSSATAPGSTATSPVIPLYSDRWASVSVMAGLVTTLTEAHLGQRHGGARHEIVELGVLEERVAGGHRHAGRRSTSSSVSPS